MEKIFSRNKDIRKIAFLNWRMESCGILNNLNMAEGYVKSAIHLTSKCIEANEFKEADIIIFPALTCFNHGVELYLKSNIAILNIILESNNKPEKTHNVKQLFQTFIARYKDLDGQREANQLLDQFSDLSSYIDELVNKIGAKPSNDKMDFSRYPYTKQDEPHFYVDQMTNIEVDIEALHRLGKRLQKKLASFSDYLYFIRLNGEPPLESESFRFPRSHTK